MATLLVLIKNLHTQLQYFSRPGFAPLLQYHNLLITIHWAN